VNLIGKVAQTAATLWILDVWFLRFNKDTGYRGGNATNMKEEFADYGISERSMCAVGATKVTLASMMLAGHLARSGSRAPRYSDVPGGRTPW